MITIRDKYYLVDIIYGPEDVSTDLYLVIMDFYEKWVNENDMPPFIEAIEGHLLEKAMLAMDYPVRVSKSEWKETAQDYIDAFGKDIKRDIKKCLRHASLCYMDSEFYTDEGNAIIVRNSPQRKLFSVYDLYGNSD